MWSHGSPIDTSVGDCHIGVDVQSGGSYNLAADYGLEPGIFMQRGSGPASRFGDVMPKAAHDALKNWKTCYGADQDKWPFNTKCCSKGNTQTGPRNDYVCGE